MKIIAFVKKYYDLIVITAVIALFLAVNIRMNYFSFNNFDFGKFDLGNMSQMLWNTLHGHFMYLTDYFGTNLPRWAMSHVDPILLLFLPLFVIFPYSLTLVYSQVVLILISSYILYLISNLELKSRFTSMLIALSYLCYPALGYLTSKTGFHGVTVAIPFFLLTFYIFEKMYRHGELSKKNLLVFWISLIITLTGKEQISLYIFLLGIYILLFRVPKIDGAAFKKTGIAVATLGIVWFFVAFFVIIPAYAHLRVAGYQKFANALGIDSTNTRDVGLENYFLSRYEVFGNSYLDVAKNIVLNPSLAIRVFFGGDKVDNFRMTFAPVLYLPFVSPQILVIAVPDLMMNYLTSAGGIGTAEIGNHRISMIIPVLFISNIFTLLFLQNLLKKLPTKVSKFAKYIFYIIPVWLLVANIYTSIEYQNPVFMWMRDAISRRFPTFIASAKTAPDLAFNKNLKVGDVTRISPLESKDRECAQKIVQLIPDNVSVSGPDYLGAHLANRETYAIFPALYDSADYVVVDVFSKKLLNILNIDTSLITDVTNRVIRDPNYDLEFSCGNLFVYKRVGPHNKPTLLPIQERFKYPTKFNYEIYGGLTVVDFNLPNELTRGQPTNAQIVYLKRDPIGGFFLFMSFVNTKTAYMYQAANLPSFAILSPDDWKEDYYYSEDLDLVLPNYLEPGTYRAFIGMTNYIKTRSIYMGDVTIK